MKNRLINIWRLIWANEYFIVTPYGTSMSYIPKNESTVGKFCALADKSNDKKIMDSIENKFLGDEK